MAESVSGAKDAIRAGASITLPGGFEFFINISSDNVEVASQVVKGACKAVTTLGALYLGYKSVRFIIHTAVKKGLGGKRDDQEVGDIMPGSLHVRLHCFTDERFLEVFADYQSGKMKERLQKEFSQVGIKVEGLKVEIQNMEEVKETKEAINKTLHSISKSVEHTDEDDAQYYNKNQLIAYKPKMKSLPNDKYALKWEAISLRMLGLNPSFDKPRAKLIECIYSSMKIKRSFNHVSILLVGTTGVGKSATVNHLLGVNLAATHEYASKTRSTKEYIVHGSDPKYEVEGLPLGLVDTPGFSDVGGPEQDACNFLSVQNFFHTHSKLSECYPNLIFLILSATNNRFVGEDSEFEKSLRCVKQLGVVDPDNPNVVTILTHVCAIQKKKDKEWIQALEEMKFQVSKVVFNHLKVLAPVVLIENSYHDCDLKRCGDYTLLRNGELQPKNLYVACASVLKENNDDLGLITLNSIFVDSEKGDDRQITLGYEVKTRIAKESPLTRNERAMVELYKAKEELEDPLYSPILRYININKQELKDEDIHEAMKIAEALKQLGEENPPKFDSHSMSSIEYFLGVEISSTGQKMLQEKFKMTIKKPFKLSESDLGYLIGRGYNILTDTSVDAPVMKFDETTKFGITIPSCAKFKKVQQSKSFMEVFEDEESYTQSRLKNLYINLAVKPGIFRMSKRAGYNKKIATSSSCTSEYSFLFEQRLFELKLGNSYKELQNRGMTFTEDFKSHVVKLPSTYDKSDDRCLSKFERFFDRFGHFVVSSAYGGGSVEVKCSRKAIESTKISLADAKAFLAATLEGLNVAEENWFPGGSAFDSRKTKDLLKVFNCSWVGGEAGFQTKETIGDKKRLQKWKQSLILNPMMLTSELTLEPISTAVRCIDSGKDQATYDALKDLLACGSQIYVEKKEKPAEAKSQGATTRKETVTDPDGGRSCFPSGAVVKVQNKDGEVKRKKMANVVVGDEVMGWDEKRNQTVFTKVIMFAHLVPDAVNVKYLKITLEDGNEITLSGNHLVMVGKQTKAILARNVKPGDILFNVNENQEISPKKVLAVEKVIEQGIFCPITLSGNVIVDNVLASCYASIEDHVLLKGLVKISAQNMAHFGLMPMRALHKLRSKWLRKIPNGQTIHPYVQWLCKLNIPCMAN